MLVDARLTWSAAYVLDASERGQLPHRRRHVAATHPARPNRMFGHWCLPSTFMPPCARIPLA